MERSKGGFILVGGIILMLAVLMIFLILVMCSTPLNKNESYCKVFSPLVEMIMP